jgi:tetratricopeptide (TPR) repeat protein/tRNA A-37 threonylcarbamoyl transferase component Bud32
MGILRNVSVLALRSLLAAASRAAGGAVEAAAALVSDQFTDHGQRLSAALRRAAERGWRALEVALAGESLWGWLGRAEDRAFREQVRAFLDTAPLAGLPGHGPEFRRQCLRELRAARQAGPLAEAARSPAELARQGAALAARADPQGLLDTEWRAVEELAEEVRQAGYPALADYLGLRPADGPPLLAVAVRYFFRREVEDDPQLAHGLAFAQLGRLGEEQERGFAGLARVLSEHGDHLEKHLAGLAEVRDAVLDLREEVRQQREEVRQLSREVLQALAGHGLERRPLRAGDSLSLHGEGEARLVRRLVERYRSLPPEQRRELPALLHALGKLEMVAGDFDSAQRDFEQVAALAPDPRARAEAHDHAYRAALERRQWGEALAALRQAAALDPERFAPFPLAKYEPERILGAGASGVAFLCTDRHSGGRVVIKALHPDGPGGDVAERFREARALEGLDHPAVIRLRYCDHADAARQRPFLVTDAFDGVTLEEHLRRHGPLTEADVVELARQMAEGLRAAHRKGVLHRDVKPVNLLVRRQPPESGAAPGGARWEVKLIDFGLALRPGALGEAPAGEARERTLLARSIAGTLDYAAPEQLGKLPGVTVGPPADVYGFARTCCCALFGTPHPTWQDWRRVSEPLAELLGQCLQGAPQDRPPDFTAVLERLSRLAPQVLPARRLGSVRRRRRWHGAAAVALVAGLGVVLFVVLLWPGLRKQSHLRRGRDLAARGEHALAVRELTEALRLDPEWAAAYRERSAVWSDKGEPERALADAEAAVRLDPQDALAHVNRARAWLGKGEPDRALADCERALELDSGCALAQAYRGLARSRKGDLAGALADCNAALRLDPGAARAWNCRGAVNYQRHEDARAIADFTEAIRLDPYYHQAFLNRGNAHDSAGDHDRAIADYGEAIRLAPHSAAAHYARALAQYSKGDDDAVIEDCTRAVRLDPKHASAFFQRGAANFRKRDYDRAVADFDEAIRLNPGYARAYWNRAQALEAKGPGWEAQARADRERAVGLDPRLKAREKK